MFIGFVFINTLQRIKQTRNFQPKINHACFIHTVVAIHLLSVLTFILTFFSYIIFLSLSPYTFENANMCSILERHSMRNKPYFNFS